MPLICGTKAPSLSLALQLRQALMPARLQALSCHTSSAMLCLTPACEATVLLHRLAKTLVAPASMKPVVSPRRRLRSSTCCVALLARSCSVKGFPTVMKGGQLAVTCQQTSLIHVTAVCTKGQNTMSCRAIEGMQ